MSEIGAEPEIAVKESQGHRDCTNIAGGHDTQIVVESRTPSEESVQEQLAPHGVVAQILGEQRSRTPPAQALQVPAMTEAGPEPPLRGASSLPLWAELPGALKKRRVSSPVTPGHCRAETSSEGECKNRNFRGRDRLTLAGPDDLLSEHSRIAKGRDRPTGAGPDFPFSAEQNRQGQGPPMRGRSRYHWCHSPQQPPSSGRLASQCRLRGDGYSRTDRWRLWWCMALSTKLRCWPEV